MVKTVSQKTVKAVAAPAKKAAASKARVAQKVAPKANPKTMSANPIEGARKVTELFKKNAAQAGEKATAFAKDAVAFNKANLEAIAEAGKVAAKGTQTAVQNSVEQGRKNWEVTSAHVKALTGVKAPADFFQLQSEFIRKQFDAAVSGVSKSTEFNLKLASDVAAPIQSRYAQVVEQFKTRLAA